MDCPRADRAGVGGVGADSLCAMKSVRKICKTFYKCWSSVRVQLCSTHTMCGCVCVCVHMDVGKAIKLICIIWGKHHLK